MIPAHICWLLDGPTPIELNEKRLTDILEIVGKGVYAGFRTFRGSEIYLWGAHALRLETGRIGVGLPGPIDLKLLGARVAEVLDRLQADHPGADWKVRIDLAAGDLARLDPLGAGQRLVLQAWPLAEVDEQLIVDGVACALESRLSRSQPHLKGTPFSLERLRTTFPGGSNYESILVGPDGTLLEGVMSGLAFLQGDTLLTAGSHVLPSISIASLCGLAKEQGLRVVREAVHQDELDAIDAAFLASSVRNVIPVVRIGEQTIGTGSPSPRTLELLQAHGERMRSEARRPDRSGEPTARRMP